MKKPQILWACLIFILGLLFLLHAQEAVVPVQLPPAPVDSVVGLTAEAHGLSLLSLGDLPENGSGTFWLVSSNGILCPNPCLPANAADLPIYGITDGIFLVDFSGGQVATDDQQTVADALAGLAEATGNLINQVQEAMAVRSLARALGRAEEPDEEGGGFTPLMLLETNSLYLELTNYTPSLACLNLHNATNAGGVYAIWSTTNLATPFAGWTMERELWPVGDQTNVLPFTIATLGRQNLFARAEDITGVDSNSDGIPDFWAWLYWGTNNVPAGLDFDNGLTFAEDYSNNIPPTVFKFTGVEVTNNYVNNLSVPVQLDVAGTPYYITTLIDDGNYSNAVWNTYSGSNLTVNLGLTEGWHEIWIGLRGHADAAASAVWQWKRLKLDTTPPALTITSPTNATVDVPLIQLQGCSPEALAGIQYDLTNALGLVTNQQVLITDQFYSTNLWEFTTNYFQGFDIFLTNGLNKITLHATDLAGNVTSTNFNFIVDYSRKTNPPVVQIFWPQDGQQISGSSFAWRGWVADPTATVTAWSVDEGVTNRFSGVLERDGHFWLDNLPLAAGTNRFTLAVTDAAGNITTTNLSVLQSLVVLTLTPPDPASLWNSTITVGGTINQTDYTVWVNGVQGVNHGDGTWTADGVPVDPGGSTTLNTTVYPPGHNPAGGGSGGSGGAGSGGGSGGAGSSNPADPDAPSMELNQDKPSRVYVASYQQKRDYYQHARWDLFDESHTLGDWSETWSWSKSSQQWADATGGTGDGSVRQKAASVAGTSDTTCTTQTTWPGSAWPDLTNGVQIASGDCNWSVMSETDSVSPPYITLEHCDVTEATNTYWEGWHWPSAEWEESATDDHYTRTAQTRLMLQTGGRAVAGGQSLFVISGSATEILDKRAVPPFYGGVASRAITPEAITILGKQLGNDGKLYVVLPDGSGQVLTAVVNGKDFYTYDASPQKYKLVIGANGTQLDPDTVVDGAKFCVGQYIPFSPSWIPEEPPGIQSKLIKWSFDGNFVNDHSQANSHSSDNYFKNSDRLADESTHAWWVSGGSKAGLGEGLTFANGQYVAMAANGKFDMYRPKFTGIANQNTAQVKVSGSRLGVGDGTAGTNSDDMQFNVLVQTFVKGNVNCLQLASEDRNYDTTLITSQCFGTGGQYWLDNNQSIAARHLDPNFPSIAPAHYYDSPSLGGQYSAVNVQDNFKTYVQFTPADSLNNIGDNIYVTLGIIQWNWEGHAKKISSMWQLDGNNTVSDVTSQQSEEFPVWSDVILNPGNFHLCF